MSSGHAPLGIFDSGLGGLTVVRRIQQVFPDLPILYYGDTARVPYGTKSPKTVTRFSRQIVEFLIAQNVQAIMVACNTASATAVPTLKTEYDIPIYGMVEPGARAALKATSTGRIGVIGTNSTIRSSVYKTALTSLDTSLEVFVKACPLFVPLVEEGWEDHPVAEMTAREYLDPLIEEKIDTLILGCTHYPLLINTLKKILPDKIHIIDSGVAAANALQDVVESAVPPENKYKYYVSDTPERFAEIGARFLGRPMENVRYFDVDRPWTHDEIQSAPRIKIA
ncbi:MAG: glutamate racemase [Candidatus Marinimicrobia bacterium]|nr:glutamate racemase [Candidatus Neomarinimicrobiota bacterium]MCF7828849.1 glutamate racemase [Candidatus Neomarinimicrobiota bacterium]MCF7880766.1 glutamate racemase [Candidatus Neomarinimicrobiota bacterium]